MYFYLTPYYEVEISYSRFIHVKTIPLSSKIVDCFLTGVAVRILNIHML